MLYKDFGSTGVKVSAVGFGGMRFREEDYASGSLSKCAGLMHYASEKGINYFDTTPTYCGGMSEKIFGAAFSEMKREDYLVSTKMVTHLTGEKTAEELLRSVERAIRAMNCGYIDFLHLWSIVRRSQYDAAMQPGGIYEGMVRARELGLVRHLSFSTHMPGADIAAALLEDKFETVLLGYNAINFSFREEGVKMAGRLNKGVATMNPLGGGLIPQNPGKFAFLKSCPEEPVGVAALRFNISHPEISLALCGIATKEDVDQAAMAADMDAIAPITQERKDEVARALSESMDRLCTGCGYCEGCPAELDIPKLMDIYNQKLLGTADDVRVRVELHWAIKDFADYCNRCIECGLCEGKCTQSLPIRRRIKEISEYYAAYKAGR